jgi:hypothetical protein
MGLYNEIYCEVELPDRDVPTDTWFQTKSLPWPGTFSRYRITAAGRLVDEGGRDLEPTGYLDFLGDDDEAPPPNGLDRVSSAVRGWRIDEHHENQRL